MALTTKQADFIKHYVETGNATESVRRAGYGEVGARTEGSRLLAHADIKAELVRVGATTTQIVEERLGEAVGSAAWVIEQACSIVLEDGTQNRDRIAALALIARSHALFRDAAPVVQQVIALPSGTGYDDIVALRDSLRAQLPAPSGDAGEQFLAPSGDD